MDPLAKIGIALVLFIAVYWLVHVAVVLWWAVQEENPDTTAEAISAGFRLFDKAVIAATLLILLKVIMWQFKGSLVENKRLGELRK